MTLRFPARCNCSSRVILSLSKGERGPALHGSTGSPWPYAFHHGAIVVAGSPWACRRVSAGRPTHSPVWQGCSLCLQWASICLTHRTITICQNNDSSKCLYYYLTQEKFLRQPPSSAFAMRIPGWPRMFPVPSMSKHLLDSSYNYHTSKQWLKQMLVSLFDTRKILAPATFVRICNADARLARMFLVPSMSQASAWLGIWGIKPLTMRNRGLK